VKWEPGKILAVKLGSVSGAPPRSTLSPTFASSFLLFPRQIFCSLLNREFFAAGLTKGPYFSANFPHPCAIQPNMK